MKKLLMRLLLVLLIALSVSACHKSQQSNTYTGTLEGGIGCGELIIVLSDSGQLQPNNLDSFPDVTKQAGQRVRFTYISADIASICQDGLIVKLTSIENDK